MYVSVGVAILETRESLTKKVKFGRLEKVRTRHVLSMSTC